MVRYLNSFAGRAFLLVSTSVGLTLGFSAAKGWVCVAPGELVIAGLGFSLLTSAVAARLLRQPMEKLLEVLRESERAGRFEPNFPVDSPYLAMNKLAEGLNSAARSIVRSQAELDRAYLQFIETMAQALDARDPYTAGHSLRVGSYAHAIAAELGFSHEACETIRMAAQLHDIGKIGIPDAVLQKADRLTPEEYGLIKLHPQIGRKILEKVGRFEQLLNVVELHHENYDGSGYPYGFAGDRVPLDARIVHVADSFDAMITTRSYRAALPLWAAIQELEMNAGRQFDPIVVRALLKLHGEGKIETGSLMPTYPQRIAPVRELAGVAAAKRFAG